MSARPAAYNQGMGQLRSVPTRASEGTALSGRVSKRLLLLLVVGDILGAGIYVLIGELAGEVGGMAWLAFGGAFVVAMLSAVSYAELVTRYPGAAGSALYAKHAFGSPTVTAVVGFAVLVSTLATSATTARAFAGDYLSEFVDLPTRPVAVVVVLVLTAIAAVGIETSARANATLTLVEAAGLLLVVSVGVVALGGGDGNAGALVDTTDVSVGAGMSGVALAFFAFLGFEDAVHLSDEVEDPQSTFPTVLMGAVAITGVIYLAVAVTAGLLVDGDVLAASDGPLLEVIRVGPIDIPERLFAALALGAVTNTSLFALVAASRLLHGMAADGDLPRVLARTTPATGSPVVAVAIAGAFAALLAATGAVGDLATTAVTALLAVLVVVNVSAIRTRHGPGGWRPPAWVAHVGAAACGGLLVHQLATATAGDMVRLAILCLGGMLARSLRPTEAQSEGVVNP